MADAGKSYAGAYDVVRTDRHWDQLCVYLDVGQNWRDVLIKIFTAVNFEEVLKKLAGRENGGKTIYPIIDKLFSWTRVPGCGPDNVKVVMIGQEPVTNADATGIAFTSTNSEKPIDAIFNLCTAANPQLDIDEETVEAIHRRPFKWSKQGVLMINNVPTTARGTSHSNIGWLEFTKELVKQQIDRNAGVAFILLGSKAEKTFEQLLDNKFVGENRAKLPSGQLVPRPVKNPQDRRPSVYADGAKPNVYWKYVHPARNNHSNWKEETKENKDPFSRVDAHLVRIGKPRIDWTAKLTPADEAEWNRILGLQG